MANWATEAEVLALTGTTVTAAQIAAAQGIIDIFSGVVVDASADLTVRDRRLLRMATSYQTVWQAAQIDVTARIEVKRIQQDGADVEPGGPDDMFLAPLANRCLRQLSWRRSRSVRVTCDEPRWPTFEAYAAAWLRDGEGRQMDWVPM